MFCDEGAASRQQVDAGGENAERNILTAIVSYVMCMQHCSDIKWLHARIQNVAHAQMPIVLAAARSSRTFVRLSVAVPLLTIIACYSIALGKNDSCSCVAVFMLRKQANSISHTPFFQ